MNPPLPIGIYVVDVECPGQVSQRVVVIANRAAEAEARAFAACGLHAGLVAGRHAEVGRLGSYDPGTAGAQMASSSVILVGPTT